MAQSVGAEEIGTAELVEAIVAVREAVRSQRELAERLEGELLTRMAQTGARVVPHERYAVALEFPAPEYDVARLRPLLEMLPQEYLDKCYAASYTKPVVVPDRWNGSGLNLAARHLGGDVARLIEESQLPPARPRLRITGKEVADGGR